MNIKMKETIKHKNAIDKVLAVLRYYACTPQEIRYIFKRVRERGKYQVKGKGRILPDYLNDAEIDHILTQTLNYDKTTSMLIHTGIFTGLRIGEQHKLLIENIDFNHRQLKVVQGKGNKDRYVPLSNSILQQLKLYIGNRKSGYLYVKTNHTAYCKRALQKKVEKVIKDIGYTKHITTHSLRHTYATLLRRKGMSLDNIQVLMGHSKRATTEIYAHIEIAPIKDQYIKMIGFE